MQEPTAGVLKEALSLTAWVRAWLCWVSSVLCRLRATDPLLCGVTALAQSKSFRKDTGERISKYSQPGNLRVTEQAFQTLVFLLGNKRWFNKYLNKRELDQKLLCLTLLPVCLETVHSQAPLPLSEVSHAGWYTTRILYPAVRLGAGRIKLSLRKFRILLQLLLSTRMDLRVVNTALTPYGSKAVQKIQFIFTKLQVYSYSHNINFWEQYWIKGILPLRTIKNAQQNIFENYLKGFKELTR